MTALGRHWTARWQVSGRDGTGDRTAAWLKLLAVVLLALNLRIAIAGLAPLLPDVQADLGLGRGAAGLLTSLPVLCFGLLSAYAALLGRCARSLLSIRWINSASSPGARGRSSRTGGHSSKRIFASTAATWSATKGGLPVTHS